MKGTKWVILILLLGAGCAGVTYTPPAAMTPEPASACKTPILFESVSVLIDNDGQVSPRKWLCIGSNLTENECNRPEDRTGYFLGTFFSDPVRKAYVESGLFSELDAESGRPEKQVQVHITWRPSDSNLSGSGEGIVALVLLHILSGGLIPFPLRAQVVMRATVVTPMKLVAGTYPWVSSDKLYDGKTLVSKASIRWYGWTPHLPQREDYVKIPKDAPSECESGENCQTVLKGLTASILQQGADQGLWGPKSCSAETTAVEK